MADALAHKFDNSDDTPEPKDTPKESKKAPKVPKVRQETPKGGPTVTKRGRFTVTKR